MGHRKLFCCLYHRERTQLHILEVVFDECVCRNYHWCANLWLIFFSRSFRCLINWENPDLKKKSSSEYFFYITHVKSIVVDAFNSLRPHSWLYSQLIILYFFSPLIVQISIRIMNFFMKIKSGKLSPRRNFFFIFFGGGTNKKK